MGPTRFERVTSRLSAVRSTWLSYGPDPQFALMIPLITVSLPYSTCLTLKEVCLRAYLGFRITNSSMQVALLISHLSYEKAPTIHVTEV